MQLISIKYRNPFRCSFLLFYKFFTCACAHADISGTGEGWPELEGLEGALGARDGSLRRHKLQHDKAQLEWLAKRYENMHVQKEEENEKRKSDMSMN